MHGNDVGGFRGTPWGWFSRDAVREAPFETHLLASLVEQLRLRLLRVRELLGELARAVRLRLAGRFELKGRGEGAAVRGEGDGRWTAEERRR